MKSTFIYFVFIVVFAASTFAQDTKEVAKPRELGHTDNNNGY